MDRKTVFDKISYLAFLLFILVSPIHMRLQIIAFDFWILTHILTIVSNGFSGGKLKHGWSFIWLIIFFSLYAFSLFFSNNINDGIRQIETKLALCLIPLIYFTRINPYLNLRSTLLALCLGFLISILVILSKSIYDIISHNALKIVYYSSTLKFLQSEIYTLYHRLYWGMYGLCSFISTIYLYNINIKKSRLEYFLFYSTLLIISFFLIINGARIIWLQFIVIILFFINYKKIKPIFYLGIGLFISLIIYWAIPRFIHLYHIKEIPTEYLQQSEPRIYIWPASWQCIKAKWLFGYGIGNVKDVIVKTYLNNGNAFAAKMGFMAHNQYLQTWLEIGVFGLIVLLFILISEYKQAYELKSNKYIIAFIFVLSASMLTESILNRFQGVILFSLIPFLLLISKKKKLKEFANYPSITNNKSLLQKIISFIIGIILLALLSFFLFKPNVDFKNPETFLTKPYKKHLITEIDSLKLPYRTEAWSYSYSEIKNFIDLDNEFIDVIYTSKSIKADTLYASIYCKLSKEFSGLVRLYIGSNTTGYELCNYSNKNTNIWEKLSVKKRINKEEIHVIIFIKPSNKHFSGNVSFTYPEIKEN